MRSEKDIFELTQDAQGNDFEPVRERLAVLVGQIHERSKGQKVAEGGLKTGFSDLDAMTGGFLPGQLIILAARPSRGKTALGLNIAANVALRQGKPVGFVSLEMSTEEILMRLVSAESRVPAFVLRDGVHLNGHEISAIKDAEGRIAAGGLFIDDAGAMNIVELRSKARCLMARNPALAMIIVDYLQLLSGTPGRWDGNRQQEVTEISRSLKALAKELRIPILALSQLSRSIEQRKRSESEPKLSDLRESGSLEQDADMVLFIDKDKPKESKIGLPKDMVDARLFVAKQRNGAVGKIELLFNGRFMEFVNKA
jgi:replicative DNA helicase